MKKIILVLLLISTSPLLANMTCTITATGSSWPYSPYVAHISGSEWASFGITSDFDTFCAERKRSFSPGNSYIATVDDAVLSGGGYPVLQETTQKIYAAYLNDAFVTTSVTDIAIQKAIWHSQQNNGNLGAHLGGSLNGLNVSGWDDVKALNLWAGSAYGTDIQSQLVRISIVPVPVPGAIAIGSIGIFFIGFLRRKSFM